MPRGPGGVICVAAHNCTPGIPREDGVEKKQSREGVSAVLPFGYKPPRFPGLASVANEERHQDKQLVAGGSTPFRGFTWRNVYVPLSRFMVSHQPLVFASIGMNNIAAIPGQLRAPGVP